jgi:hypothetical protein
MLSFLRYLLNNYIQVFSARSFICPHGYENGRVLPSLAWCAQCATVQGYPSSVAPQPRTSDQWQVPYQPGMTFAGSQYNGMEHNSAYRTGQRTLFVPTQYQLLSLNAINQPRTHPTAHGYGTHPCPPQSPPVGTLLTPHVFDSSTLPPLRLSPSPKSPLMTSFLPRPARSSSIPPPQFPSHQPCVSQNREPSAVAPRHVFDSPMLQFPFTPSPLNPRVQAFEELYAIAARVFSDRSTLPPPAPVQTTANSDPPLPVRQLRPREPDHPSNSPSPASHL